MNLKGKYLNKNEYLNCDLIIKNGKIYTIDIEDGVNLNFYLSNKNLGSDYELENYLDSKNAPYNSNYVLKYFGGSEIPSLILLKLNWFEIIRLKIAMRKFIIQSDDMKKDILKYIIGGFLGYMGALMIQVINEYKVAPVKPTTTQIQKSGEHKNLENVNKKMK